MVRKKDIYSDVSPVGDRVSYLFVGFFPAAGPQEFSYFCLPSVKGVLALQTHTIPCLT